MTPRLFGRPAQLRLVTVHTYWRRSECNLTSRRRVRSLHEPTTGLLTGTIWPLPAGGKHVPRSFSRDQPHASKTHSIRVLRRLAVRVHARGLQGSCADEGTQVQRRRRAFLLALCWPQGLEWSRCLAGLPAPLSLHGLCVPTSKDSLLRQQVYNAGQGTPRLIDCLAVARRLFSALVALAPWPRSIL